MHPPNAPQSHFGVSTRAGSKKQRSYRRSVRREPPDRIQAEGGDPFEFLWAVSYSDLLMVLLSFFIIFFQVNEETGVGNGYGVGMGNESLVPLVPVAATPNKDEVKVPAKSLDLSGDIPGRTKATEQTTNKQNILPIPVMEDPYIEAQKTMNEVLPKQLADQKLSYMLDVNRHELVIHFKDDLYKAGQYDINKVIRTEIEKALVVIKSIAPYIDVRFEGHTDAAPISKIKKEVIDSNLVLSNLRATRAVEFAIKKGFDAKHVSAQGSGEYIRNTRSISLRISLRHDPEAKP